MRPYNILVGEGSRKGITLIELMVIVAIIGILAAIAIPQLAILIGRSQVNQKRHAQGLSELTTEQYVKMYPNGPDKPPVDDTTTTSNSFSTTTTEKLDVTCSAVRVNGRLYVQSDSCRAN